MAGLSEENVTKFTAMGFDRAQVIATLKRLNYRGTNITNINENTVSQPSCLATGNTLTPGHRSAFRLGLQPST